MPGILLGLSCAILAATCYGLGVALQAVDARGAPSDQRLRLALTARLMRRRRWLAGTALTLIGWPLQMAALIWLSIVVVQPAMAVGLLVLLAVATRVLAERPGRRDVLATVGVAAGIAVLTAGAPEPSHRPSGELRLVIALGAMAVVVVLPYVLQRARQGGPAVTVLGAGVGYAASGLGTALTADAIQRHADLAALGWAAATAAAGGAALLAEMSALQDWPATRVAPLVFTVQTVLPVALAPWLLGAAVSRPGWAPASSAALLVVLAGACVLSRSSAVLRITTAGC